MKTLDSGSVLAQMQALAARARALEAATRELPGIGGSEPAAGRFAELLAGALDQTNDTMKAAQASSNAFIREEPGADLAETMVAVSKAQVSFRMVVEVRNRLIQAYQDIANMPI